jgi:hypothetical protein
MPAIKRTQNITVPWQCCCTRPASEAFSLLIGEYYVNSVLPFGLATNGYIFSKLVREIVKYWGAKGLKIIMYLDDRLGGGDNYKNEQLPCCVCIFVLILKFKINEE